MRRNRAPLWTWLASLVFSSHARKDVLQRLCCWTCCSHWSTTDVGDLLRYWSGVEVPRDWCPVVMPKKFGASLRWGIKLDFWVYTGCMTFFFCFFNRCLPSSRNADIFLDKDCTVRSRLLRRSLAYLSIVSRIEIRELPLSKGISGNFVFSCQGELLEWMFYTSDPLCCQWPCLNERLLWKPKCERTGFALARRCFSFSVVTCFNFYFFVVQAVT